MYVPIWLLIILGLMALIGACSMLMVYLVAECLPDPDQP